MSEIRTVAAKLHRPEENEEKATEDVSGPSTVHDPDLRRLSTSGRKEVLEALRDPQKAAESTGSWEKSHELPRSLAAAMWPGYHWQTLSGGDLSKQLQAIR